MQMVVAYTLIPAIKNFIKLKKTVLLLNVTGIFNTQPFMANPIFGVTLALEEERQRC